jgi:glycyl-tRNA synthetase beta chain
MEKSELLIELGVEEIPSSMIEAAARQFADAFLESIKAQRLPAEKSRVWYTPRRIILGVTGIPDKQEDLVETLTGPPKGVAFDSSGSPTRAAIAFAQKNSVPLSKLKVVQTGKGEYVTIERRVRGEKTHTLLQNLIPESIKKIQFPKTMHWSSDHFRFARPLRWIVALFGGRVVRFSLADVTASYFTSGHRFLGKSKIRVSSILSLQDQLRENSVIVDSEERSALIKSGLLRQAELCGGHPLEDPALLEMVVNLNEAPSVIHGTFEDRFLALPQEILITVMREHQKYFSVLDSSGRLLPAFLAVINLQSDPDNIIRAGHERVLGARLADAAFFWGTDRKTSLFDRADALKNVLFQEKLGSYYDKTQRVLALLPRIAEALNRSDLIQDLQAAGRMFKCDLVTEMVKEFTDLQGIVGGLYARAENFPVNIWKAIYEQYYPKSTSSPSPSLETGAILALSDRLDTVCGCFSVGLVPSGSGDPFAVRRQGNGILKIIFDHRMSISLNQAIRWSLDSHGMPSEPTVVALQDFFEGRLRFLFEEMGFAYDCVNAVLAAGFDNPLDVLERLRALQELREESNFLSLASNFKRVVNIISQSKNIISSLDETVLQEPAEQALWRLYLQVQPEVESARKNHDYRAAFLSLASMRNAVDEFFKEVMVMAENPAIRANRISLLHRISQLFKSLADISRIVIERSA